MIEANAAIAYAIVLAQAKVDDAAVVTSDHHELDAVEESTNIKLQWIR